MQNLENLLELTSRSQMSPYQKEEQRRSFAYGNTGFENDRITRETVTLASRKLAEETRETGA